VDNSLVVEKGPPTVISVEDSMRQCRSLAGVKDYLMRLANDLVIRCDEDKLDNNRVATRVTLRYRMLKDQFRSVGTGMPRSITNPAASAESRAAMLSKCVLALFKRLGDAMKDGTFHLTGIGMSAGVFTEESVGQRDLRGMMLGNRKRKVSTETEQVPTAEEVSALAKPTDGSEFHLTEQVTKGSSELLSDSSFKPDASSQCAQCGVLVLLDEMQTHKDFHFAQQLSSSDSNNLSMSERKTSLLTPTERLAKRARKATAKRKATTLMGFVVLKK
jgi:hypothetical protein